MITIQNVKKNEIGDYVIVTLSNDEQIAISAALADEKREDGISQLEFEIKQAAIRAQSRLDNAVNIDDKIQQIIDKF